MSEEAPEFKADPENMRGSFATKKFGTYDENNNIGILQSPDRKGHSRNMSNNMK